MAIGIGSVIGQMMVLVSLMAIGFILGKIKFIDRNGNRTLSKLVLNVLVPANIFSAMLGGGFSISGGDAVVFLLITLGCYAFYYILGLVSTKLMAAPRDEAGLHQCMIMFSNCGFMGYPVAQAVFGEGAAIYVTYFVIVFNILLFSLGVAIIGRGGGKFSIKTLISPVMITIAVSVMLFAAKIKPPEFVINTAKTLTQAMTAISMMTIGVSLSDVPLKNLFGEWRVFVTTFVKIAAAPVLVWLILKALAVDSVMLGVATLISAMPVASSVNMLCIGKGEKEKTAAKTTFLTTVLTAVTIPLIVYFLL
ncbi:MAG: AEC family transporter [Oscillospiraceae bacterium]|nr:AEC family transporter [Oscillospiraceae bacterium]